MAARMASAAWWIHSPASGATAQAPSSTWCRRSTTTPSAPEGSFSVDHRSFDPGDSSGRAGSLRRAEQGLGRDARPVGALAADQLALDDGDPLARCEQPAGGDLAAGPEADDDGVVVFAHSAEVDRPGVGDERWGGTQRASFTVVRLVPARGSPALVHAASKGSAA